MRADSRQVRNVELPGAEAFPTLESIRRRFLDTGYNKVEVLTLSTIRNEYISHEETQRFANSLSSLAFTSDAATVLLD